MWFDADGSVDSVFNIVIVVVLIGKRVWLLNGRVDRNSPESHAPVGEHSCIIIYNGIFDHYTPNTFAGFAPKHKSVVN
jgi:hypothetical protein